MHVKGSLIAAVSAVALLLSACGNSTTGSAAPATTSASSEAPATTPASSSDDSPSRTGSQPPSGDVTPPGAELEVGDRAVVPFKYGKDKTGTIALVVTAIEKGDNADLAAFGEKAKGITPYYIRISVENVGGTDLSFSSLSMRLVGADGRSTGVIISGDTPKCESETAKKDFTVAGATYETCVLQGTREGAGISGATYDKGDGYDKSPIIWKQ